MRQPAALEHLGECAELVKVTVCMNSALQLTIKNRFHVYYCRNGCDDDARERCYGFSPPLARDTPSSAQGLERLSAAGVSFHMQEFTGEVAANDEARNRLASVQLTREVDHGREAGARAGDAEKEETGEKEPRRGGVWTEAAEAAVGEVVALVNALVEPKYRPYVTRDNLIALQPNSHNSAVMIQEDQLGASLCIPYGTPSRIPRLYPMPKPFTPNTPIFRFAPRFCCVTSIWTGAPHAAPRPTPVRGLRRCDCHSCPRRRGHGKLYGLFQTLLARVKHEGSFLCVYP